MFTQDFVLNGTAFGPVAQALENTRFDTGLHRPFLNRKGQRCVTVNTGRTKFDEKLNRDVPIYETLTVNEAQRAGIELPPVCNGTLLPKESWLELDRKIVKAARYRLRAWGDLMQASPYGGFNGMNKMILEHETMSDPGEARQDMEGMDDGGNDGPKFQLEGLPLPITYSSFWFSQRKRNISAATGAPINTTMGEAAARRCAELVEKQVIGNVAGVTYGGASTQTGGYGRTSSVYGYTNFPPRITYTSITTPTGSNPEATVTNVLAMRDLMYAKKFYGPFMLYHSNDWDKYLDNDYMRLVSSGNSVGGTLTLRNRLRMIDDIQDVRRLDMMFTASGQVDGTTGPGGDGVTIGGTAPFQMLLIQMTSEVAEAVNGMDFTTIQWESKGGMRLNFKVMCIYVPRLKADFYGNCGILHATTA